MLDNVDWGGRYMRVLNLRIEHEYQAPMLNPHNTGQTNIFIYIVIKSVRLLGSVDKRDLGLVSQLPWNFCVNDNYSLL